MNKERELRKVREGGGLSERGREEYEIGKDKEGRRKEERKTEGE